MKQQMRDFGLPPETLRGKKADPRRRQLPGPLHRKDPFLNGTQTKRKRTNRSRTIQPTRNDRKG